MDAIEVWPPSWPAPYWAWFWVSALPQNLDSHFRRTKMSPSWAKRRSKGKVENSWGFSTNQLLLIASYVQFKYNLKRDIVLTVSGIVVSHPFHVISLRMIAQFVGRETLYNSMFGSIAEIWNTEGIMGFFAGLIPKLLCDVACLVLSSSSVFIVNKYLIKDKVARQYNAGFTQFAFSSLLYPLQVVSTCSAVSGSRLMAGRPPIMPAYTSWVDCWNDLQSRRELKRGSSLFWR